jgi:transposase
VSQWVYERRPEPHPSTPKIYLTQNAHTQEHLSWAKEPAKNPILPVARRLVWLFLKTSSQLSSEERDLRDCLLNHPGLAQVWTLAQDFRCIVSERKPQEFDNWLKSCETAKIPELTNLASGMRRDYLAVRAALSSRWSNGQTEGQINRLKLLKRQMYGKANFDLLRLRFLQPP